MGYPLDHDKLAACGFHKFQISCCPVWMRDVALEGAEKKFTLEELKKYDGKDGKPAYIAYKGRVYDVSDNFLWIDGDHQGEHEAGKDLTEEMAHAPHGEETLENVKLVGVLVS